MPIRRYEARDRGACLAIFDSNCPPFFDPSERALLEGWLDARELGRLRHATSLAEEFLVLERAGAVLACGGFYVLQAQPLASMVWGMVHRDHHREGLGRELLLERIERVAREFPSCAIVLDTSQHTAPFFERLGFRVTATKPDGYGPGLDRVDMERRAVPPAQ